MGEFLKAMPKAGPQHSTGGGSKGSVREPLPDAPPTLADIGITKKQSHVAQKLAAIPEPEFRERIAVAKCDGGKLPGVRLGANPGGRVVCWRRCVKRPALFLSLSPCSSRFV